MPRVIVSVFLIAMVLCELGCGSGSSTPVEQPLPVTSVLQISAISPTSAVAGSPDLTLTISGSKFTNASPNVTRAIWTANGADTVLTTTFVSSAQITATIPATLLANAVTAQVRVETGDPKGSLPFAKSNSVPFEVVIPRFKITSISPATAVAGSPDLTVAITGSSFHSGPHDVSKAFWSVNGITTLLATTFVDSTHLSAVIPATLLSTPVTAQVFVETGDFASSLPIPESNSLLFTVTAATVSVSPSAETLGLKGVRQFRASSTSGNADVTWEVQEGPAGGNVTAGGLYTAPDHPGTFHVIANSMTDSSKSATAMVTVVNSGFVSTGNMHTSRSGHSATLLLDGRVLIIGGADNTAELFDPTTGTFTFTGSMTTNRVGATAVLLSNGKVLIAGGFGSGTITLPPLTSAELYDPATGTFTLTESMIVPRVMHSATLLNDGKVLITGGTDDNAGGGAAVADSELYDPATGSFAPTGAMHTDRAQHAATLLTNGEVFVAGGWNGHRADAADDPPWDPLFAELYDSASKSFKTAANMSTTRISPLVLRLTNGKVLVLGGVPSLQNIHEQPEDPQYAEVYDPVSNSFAAISNLSESRRGFTATLLSTGPVLLAGGENGGVVASVELLDPTSGSLTVSGSLVTGRMGHTATRLNDGRVLVTGGVDNQGTILASAELFK